MDAGRAMDREIAEKVMGLRSFPVTWLNAEPSKETYLEGGISIPKYSTEIAAAWLVVEKIDLLGEFSLRHGPVIVGQGDFLGKWVVIEHLNEDEEFAVAFADTAPHAICLAALKFIDLDNNHT